MSVPWRWFFNPGGHAQPVPLPFDIDQRRERLLLRSPERGGPGSGTAESKLETTL